MYVTTNKKTSRGILSITLKSILHIAVYIVLGLVLAFLINNTVQAAELDDPTYPQYGSEDMSTEGNGNGYTEIPPSLPPTPAPPSSPTDIEPLPPIELPPVLQTGRLLVHSRTEGANIPISGTVFTIHRISDNTLIAELVTDIFGEAMLKLPVGDYFLRKTTVPTGFIPNTERTNFTVHADALVSVTVFSRPEPIIIPPQLPQPGRLVVINRTEGVNAPLSGSVFAVFNAMNDNFITEIITNHFGEASFELPTGDYYIRQLSVPVGALLNTERFNFRINEGEVRTVTVINRLQPDPTPPTTTPSPADEIGRLLVTVRADGTREVLQGASFTVHNSLTDEIVARIITDRFGEASVQLQAGEYFLRQTATASGFTFTTDRIPARVQGNAVREIAVTNRAEIIEDTTSADGVGRLLIFKRADGTRELLQGAVFAVHDVQTDRQITLLTTDRFGEAAFVLPAGSYYLRQIAAPNGFALNQDRLNFHINADETRELTITSPLEQASDTQDENATGRLLVTVRAHGTGENLQGVNFSVHDSLTDAVVGSLTTDAFGEASLVLPVGEYFIRQTSTPHGFIINTDRVPVRIRDGAVTDIFVTRAAVAQTTPAPPNTTTQGQGTSAPMPTLPVPQNETQQGSQGRIEIITRAAGSGDLLSGGIYAVYRALDSTRLGQVTTGADGLAYIMAEPGMYFIREIRPTFGFLLETERIFLEVGAGGTVTLELTKERDFNIAYLPAGEDGSNFVYITQTGQFMSLPHYMGGSFFIIAAVIFGGLAVMEFMKKTPKRRVVHG